MQYQNEAGIYVYYQVDVYYGKDGSCKRRKVRCSHYPTLESFFRNNFWRASQIHETIGYKPSLDTWTVYDENGKFYPPDVLVGLWREWKFVRKDKRRQHNDSGGYTRSAWGGYRRLKTTNERRQIDAQLGVEDAPPVRGKRRHHNLPDSWDDYRSHAQKSWKWQSKRKHQWKPKDK